MDEQTFWKIVEDAKKRTGNDNEARIERIRRALKNCSDQALVQFYSIVQEKVNRANRWDIWAAAYLDNGGCGDDEFEYWRAGLILAGRKAYESVLTEPDTLSKFKVDIVEGLSYAPLLVWEERNPESDFPYAGHDFEVLELEGEPFEEDNREWFKTNFPKLYKKRESQLSWDKRERPKSPPKEYFFKVYMPTVDPQYVRVIQSRMDIVKLDWDEIYGIPFISIGNLERGECMWEVFSHSEEALKQLQSEIQSLSLPERTIVTNDKFKIYGTGLIRPFHMRSSEVYPKFEGRNSEQWRLP